MTRFDFDNQTYKIILSEVFFTPREKEIIKLKREHCGEWTNYRIGMEMGLSERQIQREIKNITYKIVKYLD